MPVQQTMAISSRTAQTHTLSPHGISTTHRNTQDARVKIKLDRRAMVNSWLKVCKQILRFAKSLYVLWTSGHGQIR